MAVIGILVVLLGAFAGTVPFWAPEVGSTFGMGDVPAWEWTTTRLVRHVAPAILVVLGGVMLIPRSRTLATAGAVLALVGAAWITIAPVVLGGVDTGTSLEPGMVIARRLAHHFATGPVIIALAMFGLGWAFGRRTGVRRVEPVERTTPREPVGAQH